MKRVLLSNDAAKTVKVLRNGYGEYELAKQKVADTQSGLAHFIQFLRDSQDEAQFVDLLLSTMALIAEYNELVDTLHSTADRHWPKYELTEKDVDTTNYGDYIPFDNDIEAIKQILDDKKVSIPFAQEINEMTMRELAELVGFDIGNFKKVVDETRNKLIRKEFGE